MKSNYDTLSTVNSVSSSEEDIIMPNKHRRITKTVEPDFYDYEDAEDINPIFAKIFGTGHEYDYIYEDEQMTTEIPEEENQSPVSLEDCIKYINRILIDADEEIIRLLFQRKCIEYIVFHQGLSTINRVMLLQKYVNDYFDFVRNAKAIEKLELPTYGAFLLYKGPQQDLNIPGLLNTEKYVKHLRLCEKIYDIEGVLDRNQNLFDVSKQISANAIFIDCTYVIYERIIIENQDKTEEEIHNIVRLSNEVHNMIKFYCDYSSKENEVRKGIIMKALSLIESDCYKNVRKGLISKGIIKGENGLQEVTNMLMSVVGRRGVYIGIELTENSVNMVKINEKGVFLTAAVYCHSEISNITNFIGNTNHVVLTASSQNIKKFIQKIKSPLLYLPRVFSLFRDHKEYSTAFNVASCVQNPVFYFSRALMENKDVFLDKQSTRPIERGVLSSAIRILAAVNKLDWNYTLAHKYGFAFFKILKIPLSGRQYDFNNPSSLSSLKEVFLEHEQHKIFTYFKLEDSCDGLNKTDLHVDNYEAFKVLSEVAYQHAGEKSSSTPVEYVLKNKHVLNGLDISEIHVEGCPNIESIVGIIKSKQQFFRGGSDFFIFRDVVPNILIHAGKTETMELTGTVVYDGVDYYFVDVHGASVFVKKSEEYLVNQVVNVRIHNPSYKNLNYVGEIVSMNSDISGSPGYKHHRLFTEMPDREIIQRRIPLAIKSSANPKYFNIILHIEDSIFLCYRFLQRCERNAYIYEYIQKNRTIFKFSSVDEIIETFIADVKRHVENIRNFKYYKNSEDEAIEYMKNDDSQFLKYCLFFSEKSLGYVEMLFGKRSTKIFIQGNFLIWNNKEFNSIEDCISSVKSEYSRAS